MAAKAGSEGELSSGHGSSGHEDESEARPPAETELPCLDARLGRSPWIFLLILAMFASAPAPVTRADERSADGDDGLYVGLQVETPDGQWVRMAVRDGSTALFRSYKDGYSLGLTCRVQDAVAGDVSIELIEMQDDPRSPDPIPGGSLGTLLARIGQVSYPPGRGLLEVRVISIGTELSSVLGEHLSGCRGPSTLMNSGPCCVGCGDVGGCGCSVDSPCGSCTGCK